MLDNRRYNAEVLALISHTTCDQLVDCYYNFVHVNCRTAGLKIQLRKMDTIGAFKIFTETVKQPEAVVLLRVPLIHDTNILTEEKVWVLV